MTLCNERPLPTMQRQWTDSNNNNFWKVVEWNRLKMDVLHRPVQIQINQWNVIMAPKLLSGNLCCCQFLLSDCWLAVLLMTWFSFLYSETSVPFTLFHYRMKINHGIRLPSWDLFPSKWNSPLFFQCYITAVQYSLRQILVWKTLPWWCVQVNTGNQGSEN